MNLIFFAYLKSKIFYEHFNQCIRHIRKYRVNGTHKTTIERYKIHPNKERHTHHKDTPTYSNTPTPMSHPSRSYSIHLFLSTLKSALHSLCLFSFVLKFRQNSVAYYNYVNNRLMGVAYTKLHPPYQQSFYSSCEVK